MDNIILKLFDSKKDNFRTYINEIYLKSYHGLKRNNGYLIMTDHIEPMKKDMEQLLLNYHSFGISLIETHDFEDFYSDRGNSRKRKLLNSEGFEIKLVLNPYDKRISDSILKLKEYKNTFNYLIKDSNEIGQWLTYCLFKTTKRAREDNRKYNELVLSKTPMKYLNINMEEELKYFLDLMVVLERLCDIKSNNYDPFEESVEGNKKDLFKAKKLRNSLERKFEDLPNIENIIYNHRNFTFKNKKIFSYPIAKQLINYTNDSIDMFLEYNAPLDINILDKVQLGTRVDKKNYKLYHELLIKLYNENKNLFNKKPNFKNYFN